MGETLLRFRNSKKISVFSKVMTITMLCYIFNSARLHIISMLGFYQLH